MWRCAVAQSHVPPPRLSSALFYAITRTTTIRCRPASTQLPTTARKKILADAIARVAAAVNDA
jgi:hypothetical protein